MDTVTINGKLHTIQSVSYNEKMKVARVKTDLDSFILQGKAYYPFDESMETVKVKLIEKYGN